MKRVSVADATRDFASVLSVVKEGRVAVELEESNTVVAVLTPPAVAAKCSVARLSELLRSLPSLGADSGAFARDVESVDAALSAEVAAWD